MVHAQPHTNIPDRSGANCVRSFGTSVGLQFVPSIAFCCVLHRSLSQDIGRYQLLIVRGTALEKIPRPEFQGPRLGSV